MRKPPWVPRSRRVDRARKENSWLQTGTTSSACLRNLGENTEKASRGLCVERCKQLARRAEPATSMSSHANVSPSGF